MQSKTRRLLSLLLAVLMLMSLGACGQQPEQTAPPETTPESPELTQQEDNSPEENPEDVIWGLTEEQRIEDFTYFWETLSESYPFWGLVDRSGVDYSNWAEDYGSLAAESDDGLFTAVYSIFYQMAYVGHFSLIEPSELSFYQQAYGADQEREHWAETLNNPVTSAQYPLLAQWYEENMGQSWWEDEDDADQTGNVKTMMFPGGDVAYIGIDSFMGDNIDADREQLFAFYDTLGDCTDLIIDISGNSGGSDQYWHELIVQPHIRETLETVNYALVRETEHTRPYLEEAFGPNAIQPIADLPDLENLLDRDMMTGFLPFTVTVEPGEYVSPFTGNIWLLVGPAVYSSTEALSVFAQQTGFATLVGETTGGDGIGIDPVILALPNSGLLFRYSALYGLNPNGASNQELCTTPDIRSPQGENYLVTALGAIMG